VNAGASTATARAWVFGDKIDTDVLAPGSLMKLAPHALAQHCLQAVRPGFAASVREGDIVVAGHSFGIGSSREQAAQSLRLLGVKAVIAKSFARIFYRNAFNLGLPALICEDVAMIEDGDWVTLDLANGVLNNHSRGVELRLPPVPAQMEKIIAAGGLLPFLDETLAATFKPKAIAGGGSDRSQGHSHDD
jgi:3-isopropylmalate/(R)-2-methylmalate dehydratase small subunit